jgi:hypothetical protein
MVEVMPEDRIARLMTIRDLVSAGRPALPDNTLRNNDTGATYSFQSQAPGASYQADYANPIEIAGAGRGYRIKGDPLAAIINGQRVDFGGELLSYKDIWASQVTHEVNRLIDSKSR